MTNSDEKFGILKRLIRDYSNLSIFKKLVITNIMILCALSMISMVGIQITISIYDNQLYKKSVQGMEEFTTGVGNNLKEIENFSLDTALNSQVQNQLAQYQAMPNDYDEFSEQSTLEKMLLLQSLSTTGPSSICYVDTHGKSFIIGEDSGSIGSGIMKDLISKAVRAKGGYTYIEPSLNSTYIYSSREILEYQNMSLRPLGTLLFGFDLNKILSENYNALPGDNTSLCIYSDKKLIYQNNGSIKLSGHEIKNVGQGYTLEKINGKRCFVAYINADYPSWTYVSIMPYGSMFRNDIILREILILCFICLLILSIFLSFKTAKSITKPLEDLTLSMKQAETGDFQNVEGELFDYDRTDEVGYLQKDFLKMIQKINQLITENYEKQIIIKDTEYKALQSQIDPHFMYNTLSSVNWLARTGKCEEVSEIVISLGNLLRASISKTSVILLRDEIQILEDYINIQQYRYKDRAVFSIDIDESHYGYAVPRMILQPIVENAIKYGIEEMLEICTISVYSKDDGENIKIVVQDNGPGMDEEFLDRVRRFEVQTNSTGIGLKNINDRLKILFGNEYGLIIESRKKVGTKVTVCIPKRGI